jgi:peroxiredoxin family protein
MMVRLMRDSKFPSLNEMIGLARETGVKLMACTTSMGMMGITREAFIPEVDSYCGVATYLSEAREAKLNLFV